MSEAISSERVRAITPPLRPMMTEEEASHILADLLMTGQFVKHERPRSLDEIATKPQSHVTLSNWPERGICMRITPSRAREPHRQPDGHEYRLLVRWYVIEDTLSVGPSSYKGYTQTGWVYSRAELAYLMAEGDLCDPLAIEAIHVELIPSLFIGAINDDLAE